MENGRSKVENGRSNLIVLGQIVHTLLYLISSSASTEEESVSVLLTYCHHYGPSHGAWKLGRQSYNTDGVTQATLWLGDCYSVVGCTSTNIHTALVTPSTVGYPVTSRSSQLDWSSPGYSDTGGTHLCSIETSWWVSTCEMLQW